MLVENSLAIWNLCLTYWNMFRKENYKLNLTLSKKKKKMALSNWNKDGMLQRHSP